MFLENKKISLNKFKEIKKFSKEKNWIKIKIVIKIWKPKVIGHLLRFLEANDIISKEICKILGIFY